MFYVPAASGMLFQEVLELQVQYMIDSKNGGRLVYSDACGLMAYLYMIKRLGLIGNGKLWMVLLQNVGGGMMPGCMPGLDIMGTGRPGRPGFDQMIDDGSHQRLVTGEQGCPYAADLCNEKVWTSRV